jgi:hypothetical protein
VITCRRAAERLEEKNRTDHELHTPDKLTCYLQEDHSYLVAQWRPIFAGARAVTMRSDLELCAIDHESIPHVPCERSLVGLVDLVRYDHFNIVRDAVPYAVIEQLLGLGKASD